MSWHCASLSVASAMAEREDGTTVRNTGAAAPPHGERWNGQPLESCGSTHRFSSPNRSGGACSIVDLLTTLQYLVSLSPVDRTATTTTARFTCWQTAGSAEAADDTPAVIMAVERALSAPARRTQRQRLRRRALDGCFGPHLAAAIQQRDIVEGGVQRYTERLLHHSVQVIAATSPTHAGLVELFADYIRRKSRVRPAASTAPADDKAAMSSTPLEKAESPLPIRGIMRLSSSNRVADAKGTPKDAAPIKGGCDNVSSMPPSLSTAELLLYVILRTSIAANMPSLDPSQSGTSSGGVSDAESVMQYCDRPLTPSTDSSTDTLVIKRSKGELSSGELTSWVTCRHHRSEASQSSGYCSWNRNRESSPQYATLPYQPQCWLAPSIIALVESWGPLQRRLRWSCDVDPVVAATIGGSSRAGLSYWGLSGLPSGDPACDEAETAQRQSWSIPPIYRGGGAAQPTIAALLQGSAQPFGGRSRTSSDHPSRSFSWAEANTDSAVLHLFLEEANPTSPSDVAAHRANAVAADSSATIHGADQQHQQQGPGSEEVAAVALSPFLLYRPLYSTEVYAQVYVALHHCMAGYPDPYNLVEVLHTGKIASSPGGRCAADPNAAPLLRVHRDLRSASPSDAATPSSGLVSLLEWGCRYGSLLQRLWQLCILADEAEHRAGLGSYGRSALDALRLILYCMQRQIMEASDAPGCPHHCTLPDLLQGQQRLLHIAEQLEHLADFFNIHLSPSWRADKPLRESCSSATLLSRLHQSFCMQHGHTLGEHGAATAYLYRDLQRQHLDAAIAAGAVPSMQISGLDLGNRQGRNFQGDAGAGEAAVVDGLGSRWWRQRTQLLCHSLDALGLLLRATLRPLNMMLHSWLTTGEVGDAYDEFFIVPSYGQTNSGFCVDAAPQRLPAFISVHTAQALLHAGVGLRVLRAASTHVILSARQEERRLEAMAALEAGAAEDYVAAVHDARTLHRAIQRFIETLVQGVDMQLAEGDGGGDEDGHFGALPASGVPLMTRLPPHVDALSANGAILSWRQHYEACTRVLLEAVKDSSAAASAAGEEEERGGDEAVMKLVVAQQPLQQQSNDQSLSLDSGAVGSSWVKAEEVVQSESDASSTGAVLDASGSASPRVEAAVLQLREEERAAAGPGRRVAREESAASSHITICMNSDEDEVVGGEMALLGNGRQPFHDDSSAPQVPPDSRASSPADSAFSSAASSMATSILGLGQVAGARYAASSGAASSVSSRGTVALYGAITEELRQVSIVEQQQEAQVGQSRQAMREAYVLEVCRRKHAVRLQEWKAERLALRLQRLRAIESAVDDIVTAHWAAVAAQGHCANEEATGELQHLAALGAFVVPLSDLPPPSADPPVVLYPMTRADDAIRRGRERRASFAPISLSTIRQSAATATGTYQSGSTAVPPASIIAGLRRVEQLSDASLLQLRTTTDPTISPQALAKRKNRDWLAIQRQSHAKIAGSNVSSLAAVNAGGATLSSHLHDMNPLQHVSVSDGAGGTSAAMTTRAPEGDEEQLLSSSLQSAFIPVDDAKASDAVADEEREEEREDGGEIRRDELGYLHLSRHYKISDVNDDEFLLQRTGPRSYKRTEAEVAARTALQQARERLAAVTVDDPDYLANCRAVALQGQCPDMANAEEKNTMGPLSGNNWLHDGPMSDGSYLPPASPWCWSMADIHRWNLQQTISPHTVIAGAAEVDRAMLGALSFTPDEAETLQQTSRYYLALGQYTAAFLTHKALQLTLLPPYGSLYRLTTQFLDICLLQRPSAAVHISEWWIATVDAALEMIAEREGEVLQRYRELEDVPVPLDSIPDTQQGVDTEVALASLNRLFKTEWETSVSNGDTTVRLQWVLPSTSTAAASAAAPLTTREAEEDQQRDVPIYMSDDEVTSGGDALQREKTEAAAATSPLRLFLHRLRLRATSGWCSGAWILPTTMLSCSSQAFRMLLFLKTAERVVVNLWRSGMQCGVAEAFLLCSASREVLVTILQAQVWNRLVEVVQHYRASLLFASGVLYSFHSLDAFTAHQSSFLKRCQTITMTAAPFAAVAPLLHAMVHEVEQAERVLRRAAISMQTARRQLMATYYSMIRAEPGDPSGEAGEAVSSSKQQRCQQTVNSKESVANGQARLPSQSSHHSEPSATTTSEGTGTRATRQQQRRRRESPEIVRRRSRTTANLWRRLDAQHVAAASSTVQRLPWYLQVLHRAIENAGVEAEPPLPQSSCSGESHGTRAPGTIKSKKKSAMSSKRRSQSSSLARSVSTGQQSTTTSLSTTHRDDSRETSGRGRQPAFGASAKSSQARSRSAAASRGATFKSTAATAGSPRVRGRTALAAERRQALRDIAERRISEAVQHQKRVVRDGVRRHLHRFAVLTRDLRDALEVASDEVASAEEEAAATEATGRKMATTAGWEDSVPGSPWGASMPAPVAAVAAEWNPASYMRGSHDTTYFRSLIHQLDAALEMVDSRI